MANEGGVEALHRLKSMDAPIWLTPSPELSQTARKASQHLFSSLKPFCPKSYFDTLLTQGFDPEQIWQQIDLQTQPLISSLTRDVKRFEKNPPKFFAGEIMKKLEARNKESEGLGEESEGTDEDFDDVEDEEDGDSDEEDEESEGEEEEEEGIEDKFLKIRELEEYMEEDEAREYGVSKEKGTARNDDDDDDEEDDDEFGDDEVDSDADVRYEDFFGVKKKRGSNRELRPHDGFEDGFGKGGSERELRPHDGLEDGIGKGGSDNEDRQEYDTGLQNQTDESLSTHEKELVQLRSKIEQMEQANLDAKSWTMQGEVTASKRPYDSALGEYLDFEHNVRPVPEKSEEIQASLEELIMKRIVEGQFDDVQKASLPSKAPREIKELDENKSKKGLADIYEDEYVQQTGLGTGPLSSSDELKKEAQLLFDKLCLKLDALSHFHFKPKPIIEDMSIPNNVPALAMEEIAPVAVSDAAMLAPEEVFAGKGDIKEEAELTQAERKRRRASKKRKFKAENSKRLAKKAQYKNSINNSNGKEEPQV